MLRQLERGETTERTSAANWRKLAAALGESAFLLLAGAERAEALRHRTRGQRIRLLRLAHGMRQEDLARRVGLGVDQSLVSNWEHGLVPRRDHQMHLLEVFRSSREELFGPTIPERPQGERGGHSPLTSWLAPLALAPVLLVLGGGTLLAASGGMEKMVSDTIFPLVALAGVAVLSAFILLERYKSSVSKPDLPAPTFDKRLKAWFVKQAKALARWI